MLAASRSAGVLCRRRYRPPGTKIRVATVAIIRPPITARPSGAFCSPPSPSPRAIGSIPTIPAKAVITTGRRRVSAGSKRGRSSRRLPFATQIVGEVHQQNAVRRGHSDTHDSAHQRRDADGGLGDEQASAKCRPSAPGSAIRMMKGSSQDWKFTTITK